MGSNQSSQQPTKTVPSVTPSAPPPPPQAPNYSFPAPPPPPRAPTSSPPAGATLLFPGLYGKDGKDSTVQCQPVCSQDETVEVHAQYSRDAILQGITNQGHALLRIKTNELKEQVKRPKFELAIVLDISGSMSGAPLDTAKQTISQIVHCLQEEDTLHFITYHSTAQLVFRDGKASNKAELIRRIQQVNTAGATNMWAGLTMASNIFQETKNEAAGLRSIFLFSDGHANQGGITTAPQFRERVPQLCSTGCMTVSSFGIGCGFDQAVMEGIAEVGEGQYCYLENPSQIEEKVGIMLEGLTHAVATDVRLFVSGKNGCVIKQAYGYSNDQLMMGLGLGSIQSNNLKNVILEVETNASGDLKPGASMDLISWELKYKQEDDEKTLSGMVTADLTEERDSLQYHRKMVVTEVVLLEVAEKDRELQEALEKRELDRALKLQESNCLLLQNSQIDSNKSTAKMIQRQEEQLCAMKETSSSNWNVGHFLKKTGQRRKVAEYADEQCYNML